MFRVYFRTNMWLGEDALVPDVLKCVSQAQEQGEQLIYAHVRLELTSFFEKKTQKKVKF